MKIIRKLKRLNAIRKRRNRAKVLKARRVAAAQAKVTRDSRTTAGELRRSGLFEWAGQGMPDNTVMEPLLNLTTGAWEWVPVARQSRTRTSASLKSASRVDVVKCGAPTKDKTPCENTGDCHYHRQWRKAHGR